MNSKKYPDIRKFLKIGRIVCLIIAFICCVLLYFLLKRDPESISNILPVVIFLYVINEFREKDSKDIQNLIKKFEEKIKELEEKDNIHKLD